MITIPRTLLQQALSALILEATSPALPTTQAACTALSAALQEVARQLVVAGDALDAENKKLRARGEP